MALQIRWLAALWRALAPARGSAGRDVVHGNILRGMIWVVFFVLLAKLAGAGKEIVVAARFGVGPTVDAYGLVFNAVMWPVGMALSALTTVLIPLEARLVAQGPTLRAQFRNELLGAVIALSLGLGLVLWLVLPGALKQVAIPVVWALAEPMVLPLATMAGLALVATLYSVWIMSSGRYANTAIEGVPALVLMATLLVAPTADAGWLVGGTLAGVGMQLVLLAGMQALAGHAPRPAARFTSPAWRQMAAGLSLTLLGQALFGATPMIESFIAARLGEGAVSTLGYANRVLGLFTGLLALAVTRAMLPLLSQAVARQSTGVSRLVLVWTVRLAIAGLVLAGLLWWGAEWMTRLLFQRGQFTSADTAAVAGALRMAAFQLPMYLPGLAVTSYAAATGRYDAIFVSALIGFFVRPLAGWLLSMSMGVPGLALAQTVAYACTVAYLLAWMLLRCGDRAGT